MNPSLSSTHCLPPSNALQHTWHGYTNLFIQQDGRVIDPDDASVSTSESQAYALVRAVWVNDPLTFARVLHWTTVNLQRGNPTALPAARWGQIDAHRWGVLDAQPAADADQWIAYALLVASERWNDKTYHRRALGLLREIWRQEVMHHPDIGWVMLPGPWAVLGSTLRINPAHFLLFAWRRFASADPSHPWSALLEDSYRTLAALMSGNRLPPDWVEWCPDRKCWETLGPFGYEAFRIIWTLAAESRWHHDPRALSLLSTTQNLQEHWQKTGYLPAELDTETWTGPDQEHPGLYGVLLPAWGVTNAHDAATLFQVELAPRKNHCGWADEKDAHGNSWTWMGVALWQGLATG